MMNDVLESINIESTSCMMYVMNVCVCVCVLRLFCLEMSNGQVLIYMADRSMELCKHVIHIACLDVVHPN